jgi:hypothetical protein
MGRDLISTINGVFNAMQSRSSGLTTLFVPDGFALLLTLGFIMCAWHTLLMLLDGDFPNFYANLLRHTVKVAVLLIMLNGWSGEFHNYVVGGMQKMSDRISGGSSMGQVSTVALNAISTIVEGPRKQATAPCETVPDVTPDGQIIAGVTHQDCGGVAAPKAAGIGDALTAMGYFLKNLPLVIVTIVVKVFAIIALALEILFYIVFVQMGGLLLDLAFMIGPVLIPWYVLPAGEFMFDSWLRFTISAGLYKVIATAMMALTAATVPTMQALVSQVQNDNGVPSDAYYGTAYLAAIGLAIVAILGTWMMWQVPDIAGRLVAGGTGASARGLPKALAQFLPGGK